MGCEDRFWGNTLFLDLYADYAAVSSNSLCKKLLGSKI